MSNTTLLCALAALLIGAIVRSLKSPALPAWAQRIPPSWRPLLALALGQVAGMVETISRGTPWREAAVHGLIAGMGAVVGHEVVIEGARGGREIGGPPVASAPTVDPPATTKDAA